MKSIASIPPGYVEKIAAEIFKQAAKAASDYCERLKRELLRDTKSNLARTRSTRKVPQPAGSSGGDAEARKKYDKEIEVIVEDRFGQATEELSNALEVDAGALILPSS